MTCAEDLGTLVALCQKLNISTVYNFAGKYDLEFQEFHIKHRALPLFF